MRLILIATFFLLTHSLMGQIAVGLYAGFDQSKFSGDTPLDFTYEFQDGFVLGLTFDFGVGKNMFISVRPNYTRNGANVSIPDEADIPALIPEYPFDTTLLFPVTNEYIAVPIIYQIYVSRAFYANCGLDAAYNLTATADVFGIEHDISDDFNDFIFHAIFGWGVSIPFGRTSLNLELSYAQSINTLTKQEETFDLPPPRLRTRRFRLAAYFTVFATKKTL